MTEVEQIVNFIRRSANEQLAQGERPTGETLVQLADEIEQGEHRTFETDNARLIAAAPDYHEHAYALAMLVLQSDAYRDKPNTRDAVDNVLTIWRRVEQTAGAFRDLQTEKSIESELKWQRSILEKR